MRLPGGPFRGASDTQDPGYYSGHILGLCLRKGNKYSGLGDSRPAVSAALAGRLREINCCSLPKAGLDRSSGSDFRKTPSFEQMKLKTEKRPHLTPFIEASRIQQQVLSAGIAGRILYKHTKAMCRRKKKNITAPGFAGQSSRVFLSQMVTIFT